jgi:hypothetical protein
LFAPAAAAAAAAIVFADVWPVGDRRASQLMQLALSSAHMQPPLAERNNRCCLCSQAYDQWEAEEAAAAQQLTISNACLTLDYRGTCINTPC